MARRNGDNPAVQDRDLRVSEWVSACLPNTRQTPVPRVEAIEQTVKYAAANGLAEDSFFQGDRDRLRVYLEHNWTRIRKAAWRDGRFYGGATDKSGKWLGVRRLNAGDIFRYAEHRCASIEAQAESQNEDADLARGVAKVPRANLSIALPRGR